MLLTSKLKAFVNAFNSPGSKSPRGSILSIRVIYSSFIVISISAPVTFQGDGATVAINSGITLGDAGDPLTINGTSIEFESALALITNNGIIDINGASSILNDTSLTINSGTQRIEMDSLGAAAMTAVSSLTLISDEITLNDNIDIADGELYFYTATSTTQMEIGYDSAGANYSMDDTEIAYLQNASLIKIGQDGIQSGLITIDVQPLLSINNARARKTFPMVDVIAFCVIIKFYCMFLMRQLNGAHLSCNSLIFNV